MTLVTGGMACSPNSSRRFVVFRAMLLMLACVFGFSVLTAAGALILEDPCPDACHLVAGTTGEFFPEVKCEGPCPTPTQRTCQETTTQLSEYHWVTSCICKWKAGGSSNALTCRPCNASFHWDYDEPYLYWWFDCTKDECSGNCYVIDPGSLPDAGQGDYARVCVCQ